MGDFYTIEQLISIFEAHADENETHRRKRSEKDEFDISRALCVICTEIQQLKNQMVGHMRNEHPFS